LLLHSGDDTLEMKQIYLLKLKLTNLILKKVGKWILLCYTVDFKWVTIQWMVLNLNSVTYHCTRKMILSGDGQSVWIFYTIFLLFLLIINTIAVRLS